MDHTIMMNVSVPPNPFNPMGLLTYYTDGVSAKAALQAMGTAKPVEITLKTGRIWLNSALIVSITGL